MSDPRGRRGEMQLTFEDVRRRRGLTLFVLPDAARVEERLASLARKQGLVPFRVACSLAQLEGELVRAARRAGMCPAPALATRLPVRIRLPWLAGRAELTESLEPALRALESSGAVEVELYDPAQGPLAPFLRRLFAENGAPESAPVELVSCPSPAAQA